MKKPILILPLFFLQIFFATKSVVFALEPDPSPTISIPPSSSIAATTNSRPPLGIICGKTMCLPGETCTTYPGETQPHCVPVPLNPTATLPEDCNKLLGVGKGSFPMNQKTKCWNHFTNTQTQLDLYKKTCIYEPIVSYGDKRSLNDGPQPFSKCGIGDSGPGGPAAPGGGNEICDVHMLANTDVTDAELGGYGPNASVAANFSVDFMSQNYLYNALFDRPMDLNSVDPTLNADGYSIKNREAYRTYWRLMPASNQANLRSYTLNMANKKLIGNIYFDFTDTDGSSKRTSFQDLYDALKNQIIFFWHFPFFRVGCLVSYPVCPEYALAQENLKPGAEALLIQARRVNLGGTLDFLISVYQAIIDAMGFDLNGPYDAFVPLDFDSVRGYIVKKKDDVEQAAYDSHPELRDTVNASRYGTSDVKLTNISRENLPYIGAIFQGLLSPKFGLMPALEPQWLIDKYSTPGAQIISDYKMGNAATESPEVKLSTQGFLERVAEEATGIITEPIPWIIEKIKNLFKDIFSPDSTKRIGYTNNFANIKDDKKYDPEKDLATSNDAIKEQYVNMQNCPMPLSYHLISPKTVPVSPDDHHQVVTIPGNQLEWSYTPECKSLIPEYECKTDPITGRDVCKWVTPVCRISEETYIEGDQCCTRKWSVSGIKHGKALTVLNNPKQTDIKEAVSSNSSISLYNMLLPDGSAKIPDANIDAPIAKNTNTSGTGLATAPGGNGSISNPAESILRENNQAQDSMHFLQSCWTIPKALQNSPRCGFTPEASSAACGVVPVFESDPACKVKNNTLGLPKTLIAGIEAAGKTFNVPPALFIAVIFGEGSFNPGSKYFDDAFVAENFMSCARLPDCNPDDAWIKNIIPLFPGNWNNLKDAIKEFDPAREPDACNLLDGIFALAKDLSQNQWGSAAFAGKACFGIPLNSGSGGSTTCAWDDSDVETAIRVWEFGTNYTASLSCATKENSCLLGGGLNAQCPSGSDTCETIGNRYPKASHNACLWDMYKSNN